MILLTNMILLICNSLADHPKSYHDGTLHPYYCLELILFQYHKEGCKGAIGVAAATPRPQGHSNIVGALSLLLLHRNSCDCRWMVTSDPCNSHPPPGRRRGLPGRPGRAARRRPRPPRDGLRLASCEEEPRCQETIKLLALD